MVPKRYIRLKENPAGVREQHIPSDDYRALCDDSLGSGPFFRVGTADGFLDTGNDHPDTSRRLILLGDSFVESLLVDEKQRFASIVERRLGPTWRVMNGGYSGMTTVHLATMLMAKIPPLAPPGSKVVLFIGQSDISALAQPATYWDARSRITPVVPASEAVLGWTPEEAASRAIRALLAIAEAFDLDYGVVASPFRHGAFATDSVVRKVYRGNPARYAHATALRLMLQSVAATAARSANRPFLNAQRVMGEPLDFYDTLHLNGQGQERFAAALYAWLDQW